MFLNIFDCERYQRDEMGDMIDCDTKNCWLISILFEISSHDAVFL